MGTRGNIRTLSGQSCNSRASVITGYKIKINGVMFSVITNAERNIIGKVVQMLIDTGKVGTESLVNVIESLGYCCEIYKNVDSFDFEM